MIYCDRYSSLAELRFNYTYLHIETPTTLAKPLDNAIIQTNLQECQDFIKREPLAKQTSEKITTSAVHIINNSHVTPV